MYIAKMILNQKKRKYNSIIDSKGLTLKAQSLKVDIERLEEKVAIKSK